MSGDASLPSSFGYLVYSDADCFAAALLLELSDVSNYYAYGFFTGLTGGLTSDVVA